MRTWTKAWKVHEFKRNREIKKEEDKKGKKKRRWNQSAESISKSRQARFTIDVRSFIPRAKSAASFCVCMYEWLAVRSANRVTTPIFFFSLLLSKFICIEFLSVKYICPCILSIHSVESCVGLSTLKLPFLIEMNN